jgi:hypothetical protein
MAVHDVEDDGKGSTHWVSMSSKMKRMEMLLQTRKRTRKRKRRKWNWTACPSSAQRTKVCVSSKDQVESKQVTEKHQP